MSIDVVVMTKWSNELSFASSYARRTRKLGEEISEEIPDVDPSLVTIADSPKNPLFYC